MGSGTREGDLFLRGLRMRPDGDPAGDPTGARSSFPFTLPILRSLDLRFTAPVTFLVGENGSGKSTLLEALAVSLRCTVLGAEDLERDATLAPARRLADELRPSRGRRPRVSMFFRAEDAFGFVRRVRSERDVLVDLEADFRERFEDGSLAQRLATGAAASQRRALEQRYGTEPDARSHGESFLHLLEERMAPGGLYLLDEPETPLSPVRVLGLLRMLMDRVERDCQFVVATHSPLLMALPGATILLLDEDGRIRSVDWGEVEHVALTRAFLADPEAYLRRLAD